MLMSLLLKSRKGQGYEQRRFSQQPGRRRQCSLRQAVMDAAITKAAKKTGIEVTETGRLWSQN